MPQAEARLSAQIVKWLNSQPYTIARKRHGTPYGVTGDADVYGCVHGRHFEIEVKIGKNTPTKLQEMRLREWYIAGAIMGVVYSLQEAKDLMTPYINQTSMYFGQEITIQNVKG